jgi:multifunctional methyltransferase subunit TRM112
MRLFTHNMLCCNVKACVSTAQRTASSKPSNFPLKIEVAEGGIKQEETEFNPALAYRLFTKLDWEALCQTAGELGIAELPATPPPKPEKDEAFLKSIHDLVLDIHITEGALVCPNCARSYPIKRGIPNMLLRDDEL